MKNCGFVDWLCHCGRHSSYQIAVRNTGYENGKPDQVSSPSKTHETKEGLKLIKGTENYSVRTVTAIVHIINIPSNLSGKFHEIGTHKSDHS
jgi:hypothetical protein